MGTLGVPPPGAEVSPWPAALRGAWSLRSRAHVPVSFLRVAGPSASFCSWPPGRQTHTAGGFASGPQRGWGRGGHHLRAPSSRAAAGAARGPSAVSGRSSGGRPSSAGQTVCPPRPRLPSPCLLALYCPCGLGKSQSLPGWPVDTGRASFYLVHLPEVKEISQGEPQCGLGKGTSSPVSFPGSRGKAGAWGGPFPARARVCVLLQPRTYLCTCCVTLDTSLPLTGLWAPVPKPSRKPGGGGHASAR